MSLLCGRPQRDDQVVEGDPVCAGASDDVATQRREHALHLLRGDRDAGVADEGARALLGLEIPADLELLVGLDDGVRIDRQVDRQLADGGELAAGPELSARDRIADLRDDLAVDRDARVVVELDAEVRPGRRLRGPGFQCSS